jgi:hypothetical protein
MQICGKGTETYLFMCGVSVDRPLALADGIELLPANCAVLPEEWLKSPRSPFELGVILIFLPQVHSQLRVIASGYGVLLSAFLDCDAVCNFQCDSSVDSLAPDIAIHITNRHLKS